MRKTIPIYLGQFKKLKVGCQPHIGVSEYQPAFGSSESLKAILQPRVKFEDLMIAQRASRQESQQSPASIDSSATVFTSLRQ